MSFFSESEPKISSSVAFMLSSFIPVYILKVFTEGFVHISFIAWYIERLVHKNRAKMFANVCKLEHVYLYNASFAY